MHHRAIIASQTLLAVSVPVLIASKFRGFGIMPLCLALEIVFVQAPAGSKPDIGACENLLGKPTTGTGVDERPDALPVGFALEQNYPNRLQPSTTIRYALPNRSHATLTVFNTLSQQVALLQNGEQEAGYHEVKFDASGLASGVYFYRLQARDFVQTRKLLVLK